MDQRIAGYNRSRSNVNLSEALDEALSTNAILAESFAEATATLMSMRQEDEGWVALNKIKQDKGFTLDNLKEISELAELQTTGNPLLIRGLNLTTSNVFSRGVRFEGKVSARAQKILDKPLNAAVLFGEDAYEMNSRAAFTCGNLLMSYNRKTQTFCPIPFDQISNSASNPDFEQDVWYYQRTYTKTDLSTGQPETTPTVEWYPTLERWEDGGLVKEIAHNDVNADVVIIDFKVNRTLGNVWGSPDVLPAMPYAWAHSEYIRDASKLLKALSTIAWRVVTKSRRGAQDAGVRFSDPRKANAPAGTAVMTEGTELTAMPRSGQVDMSDGLTIASYVAAALQVPVTALLSDASSTGSYGANASLDRPTADAARARQEKWMSFYKRIYRAVGVTDIMVNFPKIAEETIYRTGQTLQQGFAFGAIHQQEYRKAFLELTDVLPLDESLPEPTVFTSAAAFSVEAERKAQKDAERAEESSSLDPTNPQGQGQANGRGNAQSNDLRDAEATPGTGS